MANDKHNPVVPFSDMREALFKAMKEKGFIPTDINVGDGYFIFDMGEGGNVHFHVKGLKGWKFGLWCHDEYIPSDEDKEKGYKGNPPMMEVFAQRELFIDKFKPSRSAYCVEVKYNKEFEDDYKTFKGWSVDDFSFFYVIEMLKEMKYHPFMAFYKDIWECAYVDKSNFGLIVYYFKQNYSEAWYKFKKKWKKALRDGFGHCYLKHIKNQLEKLHYVKEAVIIDNDNDYWITSERYSMNIIFNKESDEIKEVEVLSKYFRNWLWDKLFGKFNGNVKCFNETYLDAEGNMLVYWYEEKDFEEEEKN